MSAWWDDVVGWRDAMIPPLTLNEAIRAARKAKLSRLTFRGVVFDLTEPETAATKAAPADSDINEWDRDLGI